MTSSTTTSSSAPASSSSALATSSRFRAFAIAFAISGVLMYLVCLFMNWPLVSYHPAVNRLDLGWTAARSGEGPAMYWYGWTLTVLIVATVVGLIASMLPESIAKKLPMALVWLLPILSLPFLIYTLKDFLWHP